MQTHFLTRFIDCLNILAFDKFISCETFIIETAQQFAHYWWYWDEIDDKCIGMLFLCHTHFVYNIAYKCNRNLSL